MVDVKSVRCSHSSCTKRANFNTLGRRPALYCKQHADENMAVVYCSRCSHDSCTKQPSFNVPGRKTPVYCKKHARDNMVNVRSSRCSQESCTTQPSFNVGSNKPLYCKKHAMNGMVDVKSRRCAHDPCSYSPRWGILGDVSASVCSRHKKNLAAGLVVDFKRLCDVSGCPLVSRWGLAATQPTHCPDHGRLRDGLSRTLGDDRGKYSSPISWHRAGRRPTIHVKAECSY